VIADEKLIEAQRPAGGYVALCAYTAGMIDADGWIVGPFAAGQSRVGVAQAGDRGLELCRWLQARWEGHIYRQGDGSGYKGQGHWQWVVHRYVDLSRLLGAVAPYMLVKQDKALTLLTHLAENPPSRMPWTTRQLEYLREDRSPAELARVIGRSESAIRARRRQMAHG